jgi:hypothetical protein
MENKDSTARTRYKVTKAAFKNGSFVIERVIPEGGKEIPYTS